MEMLTYSPYSIAAFHGLFASGRKMDFTFPKMETEVCCASVVGAIDSLDLSF